CSRQAPMRIATRGRYWADEATCQRLEMTSLIDVVFLLLVFFVMTFQVTALEGDFPLDAAPIAEGASPALPVGQTFYVRLTAAQDGALSGVFFGQRPLDGVDVLRQEVRRIVSDHRSRGGAAQDL
ncbi:MAG: biopolymer transporter ExbD, partial [Planctomycetales bacterium]|nr:biopolymer transporter ExbD [Planctomycetales bacterium]